MSCHEVQSQLSLYLYGELTFAAEEAVETHLALCAFCQHALAREKAWHAALRSADDGASLDLLSQCRAELSKNVAVLPKVAPVRISLRQRVKSWFDVPVVDWASRAALAGFLVLLGFGMGRWQAENHGPVPLAYSFGPVLPASVRVRAVRVADAGEVRVLIEHMNEDELVGPFNDEHIRNMILAASQQAADPAVRMDSVQVLAGEDGEDVRNALLSSLQHDPNAAVRVKAIEALRPFGSDPETRQALRAALENDRDPAVRSEAISVLVPPARPVEVSPELLQTLQGILRSDQSDDYVRARAVQVLQQAGVMSDTY